MVGAASAIEGCTWADWVGLGMGLVIALAPFFLGLPEDEAQVLKSALVGVSVWGCP
jgi:hypothetical protein